MEREIVEIFQEDHGWEIRELQVIRNGNEYGEVFYAAYQEDCHMGDFSDFYEAVDFVDNMIWTHEQKLGQELMAYARSTKGYGDW